MFRKLLSFNKPVLRTYFPLSEASPPSLMTTTISSAKALLRVSFLVSGVHLTTTACIVGWFGCADDPPPCWLATICFNSWPSWPRPLSDIGRGIASLSPAPDVTGNKHHLRCCCYTPPATPSPALLPDLGSPASMSAVQRRSLSTGDFTFLDRYLLRTWPRVGLSYRLGHAPVDLCRLQRPVAAASAVFLTLTPSVRVRSLRHALGISAPFNFCWCPSRAQHS